MSLNLEISGWFNLSTIMLSKTFYHVGTLEITFQAHGIHINNYYIYSSQCISMMVTGKKAPYICGHWRKSKWSLRSKDHWGQWLLT